MDRIVELQSTSDYELLDESFFQGYRNEINEKRLDELSLLGQEIGEREFYGTYSSPADYLKALTLALNSTHETKHRNIFLLRKILPLIESKINFLDVGIGDGKLTRLLGRKFKHITAVDPSHTALNYLPVRLPTKTTINKICGSILDTPLQNNYYDLCLLSHSLYYIDHLRWPSLIKNIFDATRQNGFIVIILGGDSFGKASLIKHFGGTPPLTDWLFQKCVEMFEQNQLKGFCTKEAFITKNPLEMLHISGFMLYDAGVIASKKALTEYINKHFKQENGGFCMTTQQKFILIRKP